MDLILAQSMTPDGIASVLTSISSVGFAVWFAWHTVTKTLPEKDAEHRVAIAGLVQDLRIKDERHEQAIRLLVADFKTSLKEVTDHCESELREIAANYARETDRVIDEIRQPGFRSQRVDKEPS